MFRRHRRMPRHFHTYDYNRAFWMNGMPMMNPYIQHNQHSFPPSQPIAGGNWGGYNQLQASPQQYLDPFFGQFQGNDANIGMNPMSFMNPYPVQSQPFQQQKQFSSFLNQFKGQDGSYDMKKMMDTAGQMMNTVNQLNGLIKGITSTFKA